MKKTLLNTILALLLFYPAQATDLDSLKNVAILYKNERQYVKAKDLLTTGLALAEAKKDREKQALFLGNLGVIDLEQGNYIKAIEHLKKALRLAEDIEDKELKASILLNCGITYKQLGNNNRALDYLFEASRTFKSLYLAEKNNGKRKELAGDLASCLNTSAYILMEEKKYKRAIASYRRSLELRLFTHDTLDIAVSMNNIGEYYVARQQFDSALYYLQASLLLKRNLGEARRIAISLENLSIVYDSLGKQAQAEKYMFEALDIRRTEHDSVGLIRSYHALASFRLKQGLVKQALLYCDSGMELTKRLQLKPPMLKDFDLRRKLYRLIGNKDSILFYDDAYISMSLVLKGEDEARQQTELQIQYEVTEKDYELGLETEQRKLHQTRAAFFGVVGAILFILLLITYPLYRKTKKGKEKIAWLMKELNHRVKNNMQVMYSLISLQIKQVKEPTTHALLEENRQRMKAMMLIHQQLYHDKQYTSISLKHFIEKLLDELPYVYGFSETAIRLVKDLSDDLVEADKAIPLGLVINEVLTNSFKYAFNLHPDPEIYIQCKTEEGQLHLIIRDNGPGANMTDINKDSLGMKLIEINCKQVHAEYQLNLSGHMSFTLTMPL